MRAHHLSADFPAALVAFQTLLSFVSACRRASGWPTGPGIGQAWWSDLGTLRHTYRWGRASPVPITGKPQCSQPGNPWHGLRSKHSSDVDTGLALELTGSWVLGAESSPGYLGMSGSCSVCFFPGSLTRRSPATRGRRSDPGASPHPCMIPCASGHLRKSEFSN